MSPVRKKKGGTRKGATRKKAGSAGASTSAASKSGRKAAGGKKAGTSKADAKPKARTKKDAEAKPKAAPAASGTSARRAPTVKSARPRNRSRKRSGDASAPLFGSAAPPGAAHPRLGVKYECYECGAKFYDLNRPEPLCPRCGADQRARPKRETRPRPVEGPPPPPPKPEPRQDPMRPLLDDEEDDSDVSDDEELDLELDDSDESFLEEEIEDEDD